MDSRGGVVLDSSVALAWGFEDESDAYAVAVTGVMGALRAYVPAIWPLEVAKTLVVGERRGRTTREKVARFLAILEGYRVVIDSETVAHAWGDTMALARAHGLSVYDAAYLELAPRLGLPLATLDKRLKAAASVVGVPLWAASGHPWSRHRTGECLECRETAATRCRRER